jgi:stage V sporulation protein SpoVS
VDELGDFTLAVRRAGELAGIPPSHAIVARTVAPQRAAAIPSAPAVSPGAVTAALDAVAAARDLLREPALLLMTAPEIQGGD